MSNGANSVHKQLRSELENYIKSQYFGKSPILLSAISSHLDDESLLYQRPYIESSPAYKSCPDGIKKTDLPDWLKQFMGQLSAAGLGVYSAPFVHQIDALKAAFAGKDLFVSTGTGSGKTECFMWPLLAKLADEAKNSSRTWGTRGIRTVIMYPMNALVSDQVSRLRRLIGDKDNKFISIFRDVCGAEVRRPQFGMYTGRTPYPGTEPKASEDKQLVQTLSRMVFPKTDNDKEYLNKLNKEGKIPAKADMETYLNGIKKGLHIPDPEDAELITRFEMQEICPDILITNYSMLEYMLLRPREKKIWDSTKNWLNEDKNNKLLFVIDEAHMYRGSSGGEVALLIRRMFHKLGIGRDRVQFILTTASMPYGTDDEKKAVMTFARELTASDNNAEFVFLSGEREKIDGMQKYDIPVHKFSDASISDIEENEDARLEALNNFWHEVEGVPKQFASVDEACIWMYDNIIHYRPFYELIRLCRGNAVSLGELSKSIFSNLDRDEALNAVSVLLAIAPLARKNNMVLFPARMHMLFRGIKGVYACANPLCRHSHSHKSLTLGEIFLNDGHMTCPECGSVVYELYNDRRCGSLFYKGYILDDEIGTSGFAYLWHYSGQLLDKNLKEIHLYIPPEDFIYQKRGKYPIEICYLDIKSGFLYFKDDSKSGDPNMRKLFYCHYTAPGRPQIITFPSCPHCHHLLSQMQLTSFSTRGNQSFYNLIKAQFQVQAPVAGKDNDPDRIPNEGRKVLLFSDSRQRAAKLARDMSDISDIEAARQLFALAIDKMEDSESSEISLNNLYDYFCLEAGINNVHIFNGDDSDNFAEHCKTTIEKYNRCLKRHQKYNPRYDLTNAPIQMQKYLLRLFCGGYNTLMDSGISWIEPTQTALYDSIDSLEESGIKVSEEDFINFFNAWIMDVCDSATALGHIISDDIRLDVRRKFDKYGLDKEWKFSENIKRIMGWKDNTQEMLIWRRIITENYLAISNNGGDRYYIDLSRVRPRFNLEHKWFRCEICSELTPFLLEGVCPCCSSNMIHEMSNEELKALDFWRNPVYDAMNGAKIRVIDTEEHTAQLSHKDQRDDLWSKTEKYELRFQDLIQDNETPVDILSSTTTMEVGIDIGSLVAVGLRNIPPMRENYQQRAGRAGRRGASLSTIITFCEDGPNDTIYFNNPVPMFRGDPRKPWIDIESQKILFRHLNMVLMQEFTSSIQASLDSLPVCDYMNNYFDMSLRFIDNYVVDNSSILIPEGSYISENDLKNNLKDELLRLKAKFEVHPELYGANDSVELVKEKSLLDALYEEGIIPTYSFPKNVVSTYITGSNNKIAYQVERGLDVAISEYAPGRAIVVDKKTYQLGGFFVPGSKNTFSPAKAFLDDPNYLKGIQLCHRCGWFGLEDEKVQSCPFCGNNEITLTTQMLKPWGFAPKDAEKVHDAQLDEEYSYTQPPLYSTLPESDDIKEIEGCKNIRIASRTNQRIIMLNSGPSGSGFMVCEDCGASMPGDSKKVLENLKRPYKSFRNLSKCKHPNVKHVNLGYDFVTDMMVLEIALDTNQINIDLDNRIWLNRAAQSLAEALRLAASQELDIEFTELVSGFRFRNNSQGVFFDIYLYDSLSSGAGYSASVAKEIEMLLVKAEEILNNCGCDSSCHKCLRHYRNHFVHGQLDRFAGLELLRWGKYGELPNDIPHSEQAKYVNQLSSILEAANNKLIVTNDMIKICNNHSSKKVIVYPAIRKSPIEDDTIYVSDAYIKFAKPYALRKLTLK